MRTCSKLPELKVLFVTPIASIGTHTSSRAFQPKQNFSALGSRDPMKNAAPADNTDGDAFTVSATSLFTLGPAVTGALDCALVLADNLESC